MNYKFEGIDVSFVILALVIEEISGQNYQDFMNEYVLHAPSLDASFVSRSVSIVETHSTTQKIVGIIRKGIFGRKKSIYTSGIVKQNFGNVFRAQIDGKAEYVKQIIWWHLELLLFQVSFS